MDNLYAALIHYPVTNRRGDVIASALTTIDLHDIARSVETYGVAALYVVTPLMDQQVLAHDIMGHWVDGVGGRLNPHRKQALERVRVVSAFKDAVQEIVREQGRLPETIATTAAGAPDAIAPDQVARQLEKGIPQLICFGTAWGMTGAFIETCDYTLAPISGVAGYNHLSVRSAAAILLDRICQEKTVTARHRVEST